MRGRGGGDGQGCARGRQRAAGGTRRNARAGGGGGQECAGGAAEADGDIPAHSAQECAGGRRRRTGMRGRVGRERAAEMRGRAVEAHRDGRAGGRGRRACAGKRHGSGEVCARLSGEGDRSKSDAALCCARRSAAVKTHE